MVSSISISILFRQLLFLPRFLLLAKVPRHCQGEEGDDNGRNNESGPEVQFEATDDVSLATLACKQSVCGEGSHAQSLEKQRTPGMGATSPTRELQG